MGGSNKGLLVTVSFTAGHKALFSIVHPPTTDGVFSGPMINQLPPATDSETVIAQTKKWIVDVVVGCHFCPFAAREVRRNSIAFEVLQHPTVATALTSLRTLLFKMNDEAAIETAFLILPQRFGSFAEYLKLVAAVNNTLRKEGFEGLYQVASFHPDYRFAGSHPADAANYTNRSPYPMLQVLREESVSRAVDSYPDTKGIPEANVAFARQKGLAYMQALLQSCMNG